MNIVDTILERVKVLMSDMFHVWGKINEFSEWDSLVEITGNWDLLMELATRAVICIEASCADIKKELQVMATSEEKRTSTHVSSFPCTLSGWITRSSATWSILQSAR